VGHLRGNKVHGERRQPIEAMARSDLSGTSLIGSTLKNTLLDSKLFDMSKALELRLR
jgi:hypothetical protein